MVRAENTELIDDFENFLRRYYSDDIEELATNYPEQRSLFVDWTDLNKYNADLADDYLTQPEQLREYAEEAIRLSDLTEDVALPQIHVRLTNLPETVAPSNLKSRHANTLVAAECVVVEASDVESKIREAAFECQRCGTHAYLPQSGGNLQEPHECRGCERQGPFQINFDQSEFIDHQELVVHDIPGATDMAVTELTVHLEDDITGQVHEQDRVIVNGIVHLKQAKQEKDKTRFNNYLDGQSLTVQDVADWDQWEDYLGVQRPVEAPAQDALETFVARSRQILDEGPAMDEFNTQTKIITPFLHTLGWNVYAPEVRLEYPRHDDAIDDRADYVLFRDGQPAVVVEAKQTGSLLRPGIKQTKRYMRLLGADWGLATNGERYVVLRSDPDSDQPDEHTVMDASLEELVSQRDQLAAIAQTPPTDLEQWQTTAAGTKGNTASDTTEQDDFESEGRHRDRVQNIVQELDADRDQNGVPHDEVVNEYMDKFEVDEELIETAIDLAMQHGQIYMGQEGYHVISE